MTEIQRVKNRKRIAAWEAKLATEIERFKGTAAAVSTRHSDEYFDVTEYADPKTRGLSLRAAIRKHRPEGTKAWLDLRWYLKRPGRRALELNCFNRGPACARREAELLLAGDEDTIMCTYLNNSLSVDDHDCDCFCTSDLLQQKTLEELESEVESLRRFLKGAEEEGPKTLRRLVCTLRSMRCRLRHLEAMLKRYAKFREREGLEIRIKAKPQKQAA